VILLANSTGWPLSELLELEASELVAWLETLREVRAAVVPRGA